MGTSSPSLLVSVSQRFVYLAATASAAITPILLAPGQVRTVGLDGYGEIVTAITIAGLISSIADLGIVNSIVYHIAGQVHAPALGPRILAKSILPIVFVSTIIFLVLNSFSQGFHRFPISEAMLVWACSAGAALCFLRLRLEILRASQRPLAFGLVSVGVVAVPPTLATIGLMLRPQTLTYFVVWASILGIFAFYSAVHAMFGFGRPLDVVHHRQISLRKIIIFGLPLAGHSLVGSTVLFSDRLAIGTQLSPERVGEFQLAYLASLAGAQICNGLNMWWLPRVVATESSQRLSMQGRMLRELAAVNLVFILVLSVTIEPLLAVVLPDTQESNSLAVAGLVMALSILIQPLYILGANQLYLEGRTKSQATVSISTNIMQTGLVWASVPLFGIYGAIITVVISQWIQATVVGYIGLRALKGSIPLQKFWTSVVLSSGAICAGVWRSYAHSDLSIFLTVALISLCGWYLFRIVVALRRMDLGAK